VATLVLSKEASDLAVQQYLTFRCSKSSGHFHPSFNCLIVSPYTGASSVLIVGGFSHYFNPLKDLPKKRFADLALPRDDK
jgi:hypothetical protein